MHEASARIVAGTRDLCAAVWNGETAHGVNFCGGLHHAMREPRVRVLHLQRRRPSAIQWLLDHGAERVAYVDVDVHHGDGVERIFWDDPRVLTISVHESGRALFPGTGWPADIGGPDAQGTAANVALPPGHRRRRRGCVRSTRSARRSCGPSRPDVLVTQHGCDTHLHDPLAHLALTVDAQRAAARVRCTTWRTRCATDAGSRSAAAATSSSTSCRAPGRT